MPVQVTYPGVYIEEISSGAHSITGVTTATCAFLGRALMGPTDRPKTIFSFGDYQRIYGGLTADMPMSYAVRDFFLNGGGEAVIVRLVNKATPIPAVNATPAVNTPAVTTTTPASTATPATNPTPAVNTTPVTNPTPAVAGPAPAAAASVMDSATQLTFTANSEGAWANATAVAVAIRANGKPQSPSAPIGLGVLLSQVDPSIEEMLGLTQGASSLMRNVTVSYQPKDGSAPTYEHFLNVQINSDDTSANRIDNLLKAQSSLLRASVPTSDAAALKASAAASTTGTGASTPSTPLKATGSKGNAPAAPVSGAGPAAPAVTPAAAAPAKWLLLAGGVDSPKLTTTDYAGDEDSRTGMYMLEHLDLFNILCIPPDSVYPENGSIDTDPAVYAEAAEYCQRRRAMLIVDPPSKWYGSANTGDISSIATTDLTINGTMARNAAVYFPRVLHEDSLMKGQLGTFVPCGMVAGVWAQTDLTRGVWKAPAGLDAGLNGVSQLEFNLTDQQNGLLNPKGINCLRNFVNVGPVVWGARTLRGADMLEDDYKYVPVRRLTLYIEESLYRGTQWAVFQPNDENLWSALRLSIDSFMANLNRQGAFYQYKITCDSTTTNAYDIAQGIVRVVVAFAPVKPAEFVVLEITQQASQTPA